MTGGRCPVVSWLAAIAWMACAACPARGQNTGVLEELFLLLGERQDIFHSGVLEVRESRWTLDDAEVERVREFAALMTRTPVGRERAHEFAGKMEMEMIGEFGDPEQRNWAMYRGELGKKLVEVPLEAGEDPSQPVPHRSKGMKVYGFKEGVTARFDQRAATLLVAPGDADSVFTFTSADIDPTLSRFALLDAMKRSGRGITVSTEGESRLRVRLEAAGQPGEGVYFFERTPDGLLLSRMVSGESENLAAHYGNYTRMFESKPPVPLTSIRMEPQPDGGTLVRLHTVTKWERRPLERREIEIRVPKGTNVIQP